MRFGTLTTGITAGTSQASLSLTVHKETDLKDGRALRVINKRGDSEEIVVDGDQKLAVGTATLTIVSHTFTYGYTSGYAWVGQPDYETSSLLTLHSDEINARVTQSNFNDFASSTKIATADAVISSTTITLSGGLKINLYQDDVILIRDPDGVRSPRTRTVSKDVQQGATSIDVSSSVSTEDGDMVELKTASPRRLIGEINLAPTGARISGQYHEITGATSFASGYNPFKARSIIVAHGGTITATSPTAVSWTGLTVTLGNGVTYNFTDGSQSLSADTTYLLWVDAADPNKSSYTLYISATTPTGAADPIDFAQVVTHAAGGDTADIRLYPGRSLVGGNQIATSSLSAISANLGTITAGLMLSSNLTADKGSEIDLNNGTIKLGGSSAPNFSVDELGNMIAQNADIQGKLTTGANSDIDYVYVRDPSIGQNLLGSDAGPVHSSSGTLFPYNYLSKEPLDVMTLEPGDMISASVWIAIDTETARLNIQFFDSSDTLLDQFLGNKVSSQTYQRSVIDGVTIPDSTASISVYVSITSGTTAVTYTKKAVLNKGSIALKFIEPPIRQNREAPFITDQKLVAPTIESPTIISGEIRANDWDPSTGRGTRWDLVNSVLESIEQKTIAGTTKEYKSVLKSGGLELHVGLDQTVGLGGFIDPQTGFRRDGLKFGFQPEAPTAIMTQQRLDIFSAEDSSGSRKLRTAIREGIITVNQSDGSLAFDVFGDRVKIGKYLEWGSIDVDVNDSGVSAGSQALPSNPSGFFIVIDGDGNKRAIPHYPWTAPDTNAPPIPNYPILALYDTYVEVSNYSYSNPPPDFDHYNIYRSTTSQVYDSYPAMQTDQPTWNDRTPTLSSDTYYYVVTAVDTSDNESAPSNESSITT